MSPSCTSVVRIGPAETPAVQQLQQALLSFLGAPGSSSTDPQCLQIKNRYFHAEVRLESIGCDKASDTWKEDGIILVFANESEATFSSTSAPFITSSFQSVESLTDIHETAINGNDASGELLRLCVALSSEPLSESYKESKTYEQEYARRIHWCLDRGYEYVECDLVDLNKGHDDRDKEGFARIVEAIRGTVWSSAIMQPKNKVTTLVDAEDDKDYVNQYEPPDPTQLPPIGDVALGPTEEVDLLREERARHELLGACSPANDDPSSTNEQRREQDEEKILQTMDSALRQAAQIREASRTGTMTDDERRQRAGDAASLLYRLMEDMGFDDSDVDDHDDELSADHRHEEDEEPVRDETTTSTSNS